MTYQFMKVLSNVKYQYFLFVNVVTMISVDSNDLKLVYMSLYVIKISLKLRQIETVVILRQIETGVILRQICSLNFRRSTLLNVLDFQVDNFSCLESLEKCDLILCRINCIMMLTTAITHCIVKIRSKNKSLNYILNYEYISYHLNISRAF